MRLVYAALLLAATALAATTAMLWLRFDPLSAPPAEANSTVTVTVGDAWFCDETFGGGVCDTVIDIGDTVSWDFGGTALLHTTTACGASCDAPTATPLWDSGVVAAGGGPFEFTFTEPGIYLYYCAVHPFVQRGRIIVEEAKPAATDLWQVVPPGVEVERFASDLSLPVNLAAAPDPGNDPNAPFLYVAELYGQVRVLTKNGTVSTYEDGLLNFDPGAEPFPGAGSTGVSGITVEPESGDLFVSLVYADELDSGAPKDRVLRLESAPDGMTAAGRQTVIEGIPAGLDHQAHALTIGPDGKLYVNVSDGFVPSAALDDNDLRGKILRLNLDGSIPADNPDPASEVFAKGLRNPFGGAWHPDQPWLYVSDNGVVTGDRILKVVPGESYGWDGDQESLDPILNLSLDPSLLHLFDRMDVVSPTAIAFDRDHLLSPEGETHLFVAITGPWLVTGPVANGKKILDLRLDAQGEVETVTELVSYTGTGQSTIIGLAFRSNGLYFTDLYGEAGFGGGGAVKANVYRIFPSSVDSDNDGCTDVEERGPDEILGGRRDYLNFWDFFDPNRDGAVGLLDFLAVLRHFGTVGDPSTLDPDAPEPPVGEYWVLADRGGQSPGGDPWDELPANGSIGLADFLSVLRQLGHTCAAPP